MSTRPTNDAVDSAQFPVAEPPEDLEGSLAGRDLRGRDLRRLAFRGRNFTGTHLEGAQLDGADLRDVGFSSANLSGASLVGTRLEGADLSGADLTRADLRHAILDGATLERAVLHDTTLKDARVRNSAWNDADVRQGDWTGVDLRGGGLHNVHFVDLDLRRARLGGAIFDDSDLVRVRMSEIEGPGLKFTDCTLEDVEFRRATLTGADIRFANLERVDFSESDISGAHFESVAFKGSTFAVGSARDASFERCAGLGTAVLEELGEAGAQVGLPILVRAWRAIGGVPGARVVLILLVLVAIGLTAQKIANRTPDGILGDGDGVSDILASADEATRARWEELERLHDSPATRLDALPEMAVILERLSLADQAEERYHEAIGLARLRVDASPTGPQLGLGFFLLRQGRPVEALDVAIRLLDEASTPRERVRGHLLLARTLVLDQQYRGALDEMSRVTAHFGSDPDVPAMLRLEAASILEDLGETSAALAVLRDVPASVAPADRAQVALARAEMFGRSGSASQAAEAYDAILLEFEDLPLVVDRARAGRASALSGVDDPESEARRLGRQAAAADPELAVQGELGLARLAMRMENRPAAIRRYEAILDKYEAHPDLTLDATRELARIRLSDGELVAAAALLEAAEATAQTPDQRLELREDQAKLWQSAGAYDRAEAPVLRSIREFVDDPELLARGKLTLAGITDQAGRVDEATRLYREVAAAQVDPTMTAAAVFGEATLMRRIGKTNEALPLMDEALELLPANAPLRGAIAVERAETLVELGRSSVSDLEAMLGEAREAGLEQAQPVAYGELLVLLANQMLEERRAADALMVFERVASSVGAREDGGLRQATVEGQVAALVALGRRDQADALLGRTGVPELSSGEPGENCEARLSLARGRAGTADLSGAITEFELLLELCRAPHFIVVNLPVIADVMVEGGEGTRAQELLEGLRASELSEVGAQAVDLELGRLGSVEALKRAVKGPDRALVSLARIEWGEQLASAGRLAEAEPLWQRVVSDEAVEPVPRSLALLGLARLELARDNALAARGYLEEVKLVAADEWIVAEAERLMDEVRSAAPLN